MVAETASIVDSGCPNFSLNLLVLGYLATVVGDNEIGDDKNEGKSLAILIAIAMQWYNAGHCPMKHV